MEVRCKSGAIPSNAVGPSRVKHETPAPPASASLPVTAFVDSQMYVVDSRKLFPASSAWPPHRDRADSGDNNNIITENLNMAQAFVVFLLSIRLGSTLAFSNGLGGAVPSLLTRSITIEPPTKRAESPSPRAIECSLFASPPSNYESVSPNEAVHKRRTFLANFAATSLLPLLTTVNPASVSARYGYAINEKGPLVYGADDIMSQKEHGTTAASVQENLRYGVSSSYAVSIVPMLVAFSCPLFFL